MAEVNSDSNIAIQVLRMENKPLSLTIMADIYELGKDAYEELSQNDREIVFSLYKQVVNNFSAQNLSDEYYLQYENNSLIGDFIEELVHYNLVILNNSENAKYCCLALGFLINLMFTNRINLVKQKEEAYKKLQEQEQEQKIKIDDLIPAAVKLALTSVHDDVAILATQCLKPYVKCVDIKHSKIYCWDINTLLWEQGTLETLINIIMYRVRPDINNIKLKVRKYLQENENEKERDKIEILEKKLMILDQKLGNCPFCTDIAKLLKVRLYDETFLEKLDNNNDILAVKKGQVIDLKTGVARKRVQTDYCSFECPIEYKPEARSEIVEKFLNDITLNRNDLKDYLQYILGYCLTGKTNLQQLYIWYGPEGANGKTTLIEIMRKILGPYFIQAHKEVFLKVDGARAGSASPYLAELKGKRMAVFCETEVDDKLNEAQIKALTGGDRIKARELYQKQIEFTNVAKTIICSNYKPNSHTNNAAWWRRVIMIPFNCRFVENPTLSHERLKDNNFKEKLFNDSEAMSAFFNWLIVGTIQTYNNNIIIPKSVSDTTSEYQNEQDIYSKFVSETLDISTNPNLSWYIPAKSLYEAFVEWLKEEGIKTISNKTFGENIKKILEHKRESAGYRYLNCRFKQIEIDNQTSNYPISLTDLLKH